MPNPRPDTVVGEMSASTSFPESLRHHRGRAALSQERLAAAAGLDRTYVSQLERGLKSPTLGTLEKLAGCLAVRVEDLLRRPSLTGLRFPADYVVSHLERVGLARDGGMFVPFPISVLIGSIELAHGFIDDMYAADLDIARVLGLRNLSAFVGELVATGIARSSQGLFRLNPHQDGYPDLLLMDGRGRRELERLRGRMNEKGPFSPFVSGGIEVKATCGSVPAPKTCRDRGIARPELGDSRIVCMTGYDWKAHHRETNNLLGVLWDFVDQRPRVAAMFYSSALTESDWGGIVAPRPGGGRTTSVSIMNRGGIYKMYAGWLCVLADGGYREFLNKRNKDSVIPVSGDVSGN